MSCVGETEVVVYSRVAHGHRPQPTGAERAYWERPLTLREHKSVRPVNSLSPWTTESEQRSRAATARPFRQQSSHKRASRPTTAFGHKRPRSTGSGVRRERWPDARQVSAASGRLMRQRCRHEA